MVLYHYYEKSTGPLRSISDLSDEEAEKVLQRIKTEKPDIFLSKRPDDYVQKRRRFEGRYIGQGNGIRNQVTQERGFRVGESGGGEDRKRPSPPSILPGTHRSRGGRG